ncbi:MAG: M28 family peptidase, partial [Terriglobia bacterium]
MRFRLALVAVAGLGLLTLLMVAQSPPNDAVIDRALADIRADGLRAHINFLADDLLEGRGTGTRGYQLAANYVAAQFETFGLEPAGSEGYLQPIRFRHSQADRQSSSLVLVREDGELGLAYGDDFIADDDLLREESAVTAPLVFVGFGVSAPALDYDDYAGVDARGKIVVLLPGAPSAFPSSERAHFSSGSVKRSNAVAHGAVGVLVLWSPEMERRFPWKTFGRFARRGSMTWLDEKGEAFNTFPTLRALAVLSRPGAEKLFAGAPRSLEEAFSLEEGQRVPAFDLPASARVRVLSEHKELESPNVVARLRGSDPRLRDEYVVYTAHLDHEGLGEPDETGDTIYNGAVDNASGIAALLEIARAFAGLQPAPRRSVLFIATAGEEEGLLGAEYFAHHPTVSGEALVANINCDGNLMLYPPADVIAYGAEHSTLGGTVEQAAARLGLEVSPD